MIKFKNQCLQKACKLLQPHSTILDIGAYNGGVAKKILRVCKDATLYAVEACPKNAILAKSVLGNRVYNCAIGRTTGDITFNIADIKHKEGSSASNSLYDEAVNRKGMKCSAITVRCYTLDDFIANIGIDYIDLLKSNCEGGEYEMFSAPTLNFLEISRLLCISFHAKLPFFNSDVFVKNRKAIYEKLESSGFEIIVGKKLLKSENHIDTLWQKKCITKAS